jgi:hypothetical protein
MLGIFVAIAALLFSFFNLFNFHFIFGEFEILFIQTNKKGSAKMTVFFFVYFFEMSYFIYFQE